jgi:CHAD domain-containing protein
VAEFLENLGLDPVQESPFLDMLASGGRTAGDYSTKLNFNLEPDMRADEATRIILRDLLRTMRLNEAGIKADIDTEFLHDFRVAVRRTRSALSQTKGVFPEAPTLRFQQEFAYLGKFTNDLRDLDVYLLAERSYKAMLPDQLKSGIDPLMTYLKQKRSAALKSVTKELNSQKYADILSDWDAFLNEPDPERGTAANGATPIIDLARRRIYKRYKRIVKWGRQILKKMEDDQLHALRIECKKVRYLLEFFQSLFPAKAVSASIKQLKLLQTNLGDFNDLCVQEDYLGHIVEELPLADSEDKHLFLSIGYLINTLHQEREQVKAEFAQAFAGFTTPTNRKLFKKLFAGKK